jgi:glycosyltransferase involved in cell wall biosynthesis
MLRLHRRLKIAVLHRTFRTDAGGAEAYAVAIALELAKRHDVHVFAQNIDTSLQGVTFHPIALFFKKPRWLNQVWYALASWWKTRQGFDIVHSHENTWHGQVQTVHVLPMIFKLSNPLGFLPRIGSILKVVTSPRLLSYAALEWARFHNQSNRHWVSVSTPLLFRLKSMRPALSSSQLHIISPGIYCPSSDCKKDLKQPEPNPKRLLWVGNDAEKKNLLTVLHALTLLDASYTLQVVGGARPLQLLRDTVKKLGLEQRVNYLGVVSQMSQVYASADILLHPSLEDTYGMVVLEAMRHGLAVVVSQADYCGIAADLHHGVNAFIVENPLNVQTLAHAVKDLSLPLAYKNYVVKAIEFAEQHVWADAAAAYEVLFEKLTHTQ